MNRNTWLSILICLNVALLVAIGLTAAAPRSALAQATGLSGNYLAVCAEVQDQFDALYLIDYPSKTLHAFTWDRGRRQLEYANSRDLRRDFRHDRD